MVALWLFFNTLKMWNVPGKPRHVVAVIVGEGKCVPQKVKRIADFIKSITGSTIVPKDNVETLSTLPKFRNPLRFYKKVSQSKVSEFIPEHRVFIFAGSGSDIEDSENSEQSVESSDSFTTQKVSNIQSKLTGWFALAQLLPNKVIILSPPRDLLEFASKSPKALANSQLTMYGSFNVRTLIQNKVCTASEFKEFLDLFASVNYCENYFFCPEERMPMCILPENAIQSVGQHVLQWNKHMIINQRKIAQKFVNGIDDNDNNLQQLWNDNKFEQLAKEDWSHLGQGKENSAIRCFEILASCSETHGGPRKDTCLLSDVGTIIVALTPAIMLSRHSAKNINFDSNGFTVLVYDSAPNVKDKIRVISGGPASGHATFRDYVSHCLQARHVDHLPVSDFLSLQ